MYSNSGDMAKCCFNVNVYLASRKLKTGCIIKQLHLTTHYS